MKGDGEEEGGGLFNLDMGSFGSGSMSDPLRHAVGMRTAQDQCKMRMWNSFPQIFQNTIFHGEQDSDIKSLRHEGSLEERLARGRKLKAEGNAAFKTATKLSKDAQAGPKKVEETQQEELRLRLVELEAAVVSKELELKALRQDLADARKAADAARIQQEESAKRAAAVSDNAIDTEGLEAAITNYEKAAGLLRYVECIRPDWKNDDGSYKGIEDEHLRVDASALEGDSKEADEARELVASSYLNVALACQKLGDFERMRNACDEVLAHVDAQNIKALYRRAQARTAPVGALETDRDASIQDLASAARLAPQDKEVRGLLAKLRAQRKAQEVSDRSTFAGLFDRGTVVTTDPRTEGEKPDPSKLDIRDPKVQAMLDIHPGPQGFIDA